MNIEQTKSFFSPRETKSIKKIRNLAIASLVIDITWFLSFLMGVFMLLFFYDYDGTSWPDFDEPLWDGDDNTMLFLYNLQPWASVIIGVPLARLLSFIGSLFVLGSKWENLEAKKHKTVWGLLSLFVLSWIGLFVFVKKINSKNSKVDSNKKQEQQIEVKKDLALEAKEQQPVIEVNKPINIEENNQQAIVAKEPESEKTTLIEAKEQLRTDQMSQEVAINVEKPVDNIQEEKQNFIVVDQKDNSSNGDNK